MPKSAIKCRDIMTIVGRAMGETGPSLHDSQESGDLHQSPFMYGPRACFHCRCESKAAASSLHMHMQAINKLGVLK